MEHILQEAVEPDINLQALAVLRNCLRLMQADIRRPLQPRTIIKMCLDRHKQRILRQPGCLLFHKRPEIRRFVFMEAGERRLQHMKPLVIHLPEVNLIVALRPLYALQRLSCQPALFHQLFWVNQIRIARKRRKALVRRVAVARRAERENLPVFLPRLLQEIHKGIRFLSQISNAVFRRQRCDMQQNSAASFHKNPSIL